MIYKLGRPWDFCKNAFENNINSGTEGVLDSGVYFTEQLPIHSGMYDCEEEFEFDTEKDWLGLSAHQDTLFIFKGYKPEEVKIPKNFGPWNLGTTFILEVKKPGYYIVLNDDD